MNDLARTLTCCLLAMAAGIGADVPVADDREARSAQWVEAVARQAQEAQRRQREARLRWEYERSRSAAHARMPNTLYASTPSFAGDVGPVVPGAGGRGYPSPVPRFSRGAPRESEGSQRIRHGIGGILA